MGSGSPPTALLHRAEQRYSALDGCESTAERADHRRWSSRRHERAPARGAPGRCAPVVGRARPARVAVLPSGRRAAATAGGRGRHHGLPRDGRPPGAGVHPGRDHPKPPCAAPARRGRPARARHAGDRRVPSRHRRRLLRHDRLGPRRDAPRGGHRRVRLLRADDHVDHAVLPRPPARPDAMSRCCIVPPTMLDRIARHGTKAQRDRALGAIALDATIRQARVQNQLLRGVRGHREGPDALAALENQGANREIRDAQGAEQVMRGPIVRTEGQPPTGDAAADEAYDGLGATYDFWEQAYDRNSIDDADMPLRGVVHYGQDYDNAFWDGRRMIFGDGDGELFVRFTRSLDVIGHELGHGVIEDEAALAYQGQSGALNESLADVFGSLVKQFTLGQEAAAADWLIGADLRGPQFHGDALRNMRAPGTAYDDPVLGKDPQPDSMDGYVQTTDDNGGVHLNSGIPNKAFTGLAVALGGNAWDRAGAIWYDALRDPRLRANATFAQFAAITRDVGATRFGVGDEVAAAW